MTASADDIVRALGLAPHPEGGHYREIHRDTPNDGSRGASTSIYFLLRGHEISRWHRIDAVETWHFHLGAPLRLDIAHGGIRRADVLGPDVLAGHGLQATVPTGAWQSARSLGAWTLVGCTVAPAFEFSGFELAPPDWNPEGWEPE